MKKFSLGLILLFISISTYSQSISWAHHVGSDKADNLESHAIDKDGNIIAVGYFEKTIKIGRVQLTSKEESDIFIYKSRPNGEIIWAHTFGGPSYGGDVGIAVDGNKNIYIAGGFVNKLYLDDQLKLTGINRWNSFVAKLKPDGSLIWVKGILATADPSEVRVWGNISVTKDGDAVVSGIFSGDINIVGVPLSVDLGSAGFFIARLNPNGQVIWVRNPPSFAVVNDIHLDKNNFIYLTGRFTGTLHFDEYSLTAANSTHSDIFLVKYDFEGNVIWAKAGIKTTSAELNNEGLSSSVDDETGDVYLTGLFKGSVQFDSFIINGINTSEDPGNADIFVAKLNSMGNVQWINRIGTNDHDIADYITITPQKTIIISGGRGTEFKLFYEEFDLEGNSLSEANFDGTGSISHVSVKSNGDMYFSGHLYSNLITPEVEILVTGEMDGFLFKIADCSPSNFPIKPLLTSQCKHLNIINSTNPEYEIEWYKNEVLLSNENDLILDLGDNGVYYAHFINDCGRNQSDPYPFEIPEIKTYNVITPNGDLLNELYILEDLLIGSIVTVYNRWGKSVYQNNNYKNTWGGDNLTSGTYYVIIRNACWGEFKDFLNIIR